MKKVFFPAFVVAILIFTFNVFAGVKPNRHLAVLSEYQNLSKTFGELLNEMEAFGGVSSVERSEIEAFLKTKSISLDTPTTKASVNGDTLIYGSQRLTLLPDGSFKTKSGKIIKEAKNEARDITFKKTFSALVEKEYSLRFPLRFLIEEANAGPFADFVDAATAAIGRTLWTGFSAVVIPVCGVVAVPVDGLLWVTKKLIFEGTVSCDGERYTMTHYDEFWKQLKTDYENTPRRIGGKLTWWSELDKVGGAVCSGPLGRAILEDVNLSDSRIKKDVISRDSLQEAFSDKQVPACNKENSRVVEAYIKKKLSNLKEAVQLAIKKGRLGADLSSDSVDPERGKK